MECRLPSPGPSGHPIQTSMTLEAILASKRYRSIRRVPDTLAPFSHASNEISIDTPLEFTLFQNLPPELRLGIWERTICSRTIIVDNYNPKPDPGPATLQACKESCMVTISAGYKLLRQGNNSNYDKELYYWINFDIDTIHYVAGPGDYAGFKASIYSFLTDMELRIGPWWIKNIQMLSLTADMDHPENSDLQPLRLSLYDLPALPHKGPWRALLRQCTSLAELKLDLKIASRGGVLSVVDLGCVFGTTIATSLYEKAGNSRREGRVGGIAEFFLGNSSRGMSKNNPGHQGPWKVTMRHYKDGTTVNISCRCTHP